MRDDWCVQANCCCYCCCCLPAAAALQYQGYASEFWGINIPTVLILQTLTVLADHRAGERGVGAVAGSATHFSLVAHSYREDADSFRCSPTRLYQSPCDCEAWQLRSSQVAGSAQWSVEHGANYA
jgi:hypothetical protein